MSKETGAHEMNDTTRGELREQVGGELVTVYAIGHNREVADLSDTADRIIALVTAAGDDLGADMTLVYMKGWQDGQDAMRKSVDAAVDSASRKEANDE